MAPQEATAQMAEPTTFREFVEKNIADGFVGTVEVTCTPDIAQVLLEFNEHNRPIRSKWVTQLAGYIRRGEWRKTMEPIIFSSVGEMIDGQHRLLAVVRAGIPVDVVVAFGADAEAFDCIGTNRTRSLADNFALHGVKNYAAASSMTLWVMAYDTENYLVPSRGRHISNSEVYKYYCDNVGVADSAWVYDKSARAGLFGAVQLGAVHYLVQREGAPEEQVNEFFEAVMTGIGFTDEYDPRLLLRTKLQQWSGRYVDRPPRFTVFAVIVKAWNAWYESRQIKALRMHNDEAMPRLVTEARDPTP